MPVGIRERLEAALARVRGAERLTFREVDACLRAACPVVMAAGCSKAAFSAAAGQIIDALVEGKVLERADARSEALVLISAVLYGIPAVNAALAHADSAGGGECGLCNGAHWDSGTVVKAPVRGAGQFPLSMAMPDRRVTISGALRSGKRFRAAQGSFSCDHSHPRLDDAALRRLLRSLGPDFGPEPPTGGSLARV